MKETPNERIFFLFGWNFESGSKSGTKNRLATKIARKYTSNLCYSPGTFLSFGNTSVKDMKDPLLFSIDIQTTWLRGPVVVFREVKNEDTTWTPADFTLETFKKEFKPKRRVEHNNQ